MSAFACDLHIHSCLSPCGDEAMTPNSIAGMAKLNGLQIVALTDHNTCGNDEAFFTACARYGIIPVAGMELTTSEDVHLLCLFRTLADVSCVILAEGAAPDKGVAELAAEKGVNLLGGIDSAFALGARLDKLL